MIINEVTVVFDLVQITLKKTSDFGQRSSLLLKLIKLDCYRNLKSKDAKPHAFTLISLLFNRYGDL